MPALTSVDRRTMERCVKVLKSDVLFMSNATLRIAKSSKEYYKLVSNSRRIMVSDRPPEFCFLRASGDRRCSSPLRRMVHIHICCG